MEITCKICGNKEIPDHWFNGQEMIEHQMCFLCNFWREKQEIDRKRNPHTWAVINGVHYYLDPPTNSPFQGFGGHNFKIRFNDGFETECNNLWCQGDIPPGYWRLVFPDNAEFIKKDNYYE